MFGGDAHAVPCLEITTPRGRLFAMATTPESGARNEQRSFRQSRRRVEREVRLVRRDLEKQSDTLSNRVEKILGEAQDRLSSVA